MRKQEPHPRTVVINRSQKIRAKKQQLDALQWLAKRFPQAFDNTLTIRPLKNGIMHDILSYADEAASHNISKTKLREAVVIFTRRIDYLICLKAREMRVDLEGNPTVEVSIEDAERAALKIRKRIEKTIRNSRKTTTATATVKNHQPEPYQPSFMPQNRTPLYSTQAETTPSKQVSVTIKHKSTKPYDPAAVARLKARLGLSLEKETAE